MKLTVKQIDLMSKWLAAINLGTSLERTRFIGESLPDHIKRLWNTAVANHDEVDVDITGEALSFVKELKNPKKNQYWIDQLKKAFGDNALAELC